MVAHLAVAAALICVDPGHGTVPAIGAQTEPIAPGSHVVKIKDGGGAPGEAQVALAISLKLRGLLVQAGYRVALTRTRDGYRGGNIARAQFCNARHAALMLRIHADGSTNTATHGVATLYKRGYRDDAVLMQRALVETTHAADRGVVIRTDLTGFNWATVPAILVETGFLSNPRERALLQSARYQQVVARGLAAGVRAIVRP